MRRHDEGIGADPARALLLHGTMMAWHLALFSSLALIDLPTALEPLPAMPDGLKLVPRTANAMFGLISFGLFVGVALPMRLDGCLDAASSRLDVLDTSVGGTDHRGDGEQGLDLEQVLDEVAGSVAPATEGGAALAEADAPAALRHDGWRRRWLRGPG